MSTESLAAAWLDAKALEAEAVAARRAAEDALIDELRLADHFDGTKAVEIDRYVIKVTARQSRRIDGDKLQTIALENGLHDHLSSLFRWKPEIDARAWKAADSSITRPLLDAITTTPGRASFAITERN